MAISVRCPHCRHTFQLRDELAGRTVRCKCGKPLPVPDASTNAPLSNLLEDELVRPSDPPPERKAPEKPPTKYQPIPPPGYTPEVDESLDSEPRGPKWQPKPKTQDDTNRRHKLHGLGWILIMVIIIVGNLILYLMTAE